MWKLYLKQILKMCYDMVLVITDDMMFTDNADWAGHIRVRLINYCGNLYYHKMIDGKIIDFKVVGKANA